MLNVPHRNRFFTGRKDVLERLRATLDRAGTAAIGQVQAISGLGGIGKTQTALEYAYRYADKYSHILWVRAETESELAAGYAQLARQLNLVTAEAQDDQIRHAVRAWLEDHDRWLVLFDNADTPRLLLPFLPRQSRGHILLTSRARVFDEVGILQPQRMPLLPPAEAMAFLLDRTGRKDADQGERAAAAELGETLGYLPLALEQAGAYMLALDVSFEAYLKSYRRNPWKKLKQPLKMGSYPETVAAVTRSSRSIHASARSERYQPKGIPSSRLDQGKSRRPGRVAPEDPVEIAGAMDDSKDPERLGLWVVDHQVAVHPPPSNAGAGRSRANPADVRRSGHHLKGRAKVGEDLLRDIKAPALLCDVAKDGLELAVSKRREDPCRHGSTGASPVFPKSGCEPIERFRSVYPAVFIAGTNTLFDQLGKVRAGALLQLVGHQRQLVG